VANVPGSPSGRGRYAPDPAVSITTHETLRGPYIPAIIRLAAAVLAALLVAGCQAASTAVPTESASPREGGPSDPAPAGSVTGTPNRTPLPIGSEPLRLVTLGDSYTLGARVRRQDTWPSQLIRALSNRVPMQLAANLAQMGKSSQDVIDEQLWVVGSLQPQLVGLQVGVNDVIFPGITLDDYRANIDRILDELLELLPPERIFVVTSPDYTLTAHGADYGDPHEQRAAIGEVNRILKEAAASRDILAVDISPASDRVTDDPSLLTSDGLHPSAKQYAAWVELIAPRLHAALLGLEP
jgi:acyl-CoA thioesterase I